MNDYYYQSGAAGRTEFKRAPYLFFFAPCFLGGVWYNSKKMWRAARQRPRHRHHKEEFAVQRNYTPFGIIYKVTAPSGRCYVGQTTQTLAARRSQHNKKDDHCTLLLRAIRKYGDRMEWSVIACAANKEDLDFAERELIRQHNTLAPHGYNLMDGGGANGKHSAETIAKIKQRLATPSVRAKMRAWHSGKTLSQTHRDNIGAAFVGRKRSPETIAKMKAGHIGRKRSAAACANIKAAAQLRAAKARAAR